MPLLLSFSSQAFADARTDARRHFRAGMALIAAAKYEAGIAELEEANRILPHPNVAYNIARAYLEAENPERALAAFRNYLESDPPDREQVAAIIADLETKIATRFPKPIPHERPEETKPAPPAEPSRSTGNIEPATLAETAREPYQEKIITASRGEQTPLEAPSSTTILTRQDIRLSGITRIPELLRRVAGVEVMQITGGDANVSIRGFNGRLANKVLVLVNGRSVQNDFLGATFWESLSVDVDQIERIEVTRGPSSALYGANAFSGVINIITIEPGEGSDGARVGYGTQNQAYGSVWVTGREESTTYRASAGYTRYPRWTREVSRERVDLHFARSDQELGAENARADLRATTKLSNATELHLGGGFARSNLDIYGVGPFNDYVVKLDTLDVTSVLRWEHFQVRGYYTRVNAEASSNTDYIGHSLYLTHPVQDLYNIETEFSDRVLFPQGIEHAVQAGIGYRHKSIQWDYLEHNTPPENHASVFLQDSLKLSQAVTLVLSGRLDYVPYFTHLIPSPRVSLISKPGEGQALRLSGSTAFRSPTYLESYVNLPIQLNFPGVEVISSTKREDDPSFKLRPEQIITAEASYLNQKSDFFEFEVTGYYNRISDLIALAQPWPNTLSSRVFSGLNPDTSRFTVGRGGWLNQCDRYHVLGSEIGAHVYPASGLDLFANYALNYSIQELPRGCNIPEDRRTSQHEFNAGVQLRTPLGIDSEVSFHYQSPQTWNEQVATTTGIEYQQFDLPAYTLLNGRTGYRFARDRAELSLTIFNALADVFQPSPQMHPFGNRVGRRVMTFFAYTF